MYPAPPDTTIHNASQDTISSISFHRHRVGRFLTTSWDRCVRVYDLDRGVESGAKRSVDGAIEADGPSTPLSTIHLPAPTLSASFLSYNSDSNIVFAGGLHPDLSMHDLHSGATFNVGRHKSGISHVSYSPYQEVVVTAGLDHSVKCWDARLPYDTPVHWVSQPGLIYATCLQGPVLACAFRSRNRLMLWDVRRMSWRLPLQRRSLLIRQQPISSLDISGDGLSMAYGSDAGRFALETMRTDEKAATADKFIAVAHRRDAVCYPVSCLRFYKNSTVLVTGGGDGVVKVWNTKTRKNVAAYKYPESVTSLAFNPTGSHLVLASSGAGIKTSQNTHTLYIKDVGRSVRRWCEVV